jgi:hypothetical protein
MNTIKHEVKNKFSVTSDFIIEAIETFFNMQIENNPDLVNTVHSSLKDELIDFVNQCSNDNTPSSHIFDNYLINEILSQFQEMHSKQ